eukprot:1027299-Prymnesium_polylepis.1
MSPTRSVSSALGGIAAEAAQLVPATPPANIPPGDGIKRANTIPIFGSAARSGSSRTGAYASRRPSRRAATAMAPAWSSRTIPTRRRRLALRRHSWMHGGALRAGLLHARQVRSGVGPRRGGGRRPQRRAGGARAGVAL